MISGEGILTLDGGDIHVASGSIVRVSPAVSRQLRNTGTSPLLHVCIQAKAGSLEHYTMSDGVLLEE